MLRRIAILCALWVLPASGQDGLLGTWEHSQDGGLYLETRRADVPPFSTTRWRAKLPIAATFREEGTGLLITNRRSILGLGRY